MRLTALFRLIVTGEKRMQALSLKAFLTRLIWLCVLPLVILAVFLAINHVHTLQDQRDQEAADQARNVATAIDRHIGAQIAALQMLAVSPLMDDPPRLLEFYNETRGFRESFGGHVILADLSMQMIFNTREPFGTALPKLPRPKGHAAAPAALATGKPAVGDMFFGPVAKEPLVAVAVPIIRDSQTKFLLISTIETHQLQQNLDEVALPAGWSLTLLDGKDEVMARRLPPEIEDRQIAAVASGRFVAKSGASHWSVVLEVPRGVYRTPVIVAAVALTAGILAVTLVSVMGGRMAGRRLAQSVEALAEIPSPNASRLVISEIEAVRSLLHESAAAREAAELTRSESEHRFCQLFDIAPVPLCFVNKDGALVNSNARFKQTFGYAHDDVANLSDWWQLAYPDPDYRRWVLETWEAAVRHARENNSDIEPIEYRVTCKDGKVLTVVISGTIIRDDFLATFFDITERKQAEIALHNSLDEKVALLKEVHHRVKNNLQIVASLLNLQANRAHNRQVEDVLLDTRNRVHSMALLHELLYRSGNLARINFAAYVGELCTQLLRSSGPAGARVKVENRIARIGLPLEQSVPCGLIINELVSNALKHGFPDQRTGRVAVELEPTEGQRLQLCVRDDGVGLSPGMDIANKSTLGLQLVSGLAIQLGGQLETHPSDVGGTAFCVSFPILGDTVFEDES